MEITNEKYKLLSLLDTVSRERIKLEIIKRLLDLPYSADVWDKIWYRPDISPRGKREIAELFLASNATHWQKQLAAEGVLEEAPFPHDYETIQPFVYFIYEGHYKGRLSEAVKQGWPVHWALAYATENLYRFSNPEIMVAGLLEKVLAWESDAPDAIAWIVRRLDETQLLNDRHIAELLYIDLLERPSRYTPNLDVVEIILKAMGAR